MPLEMVWICDHQCWHWLSKLSKCSIDSPPHLSEGCIENTCANLVDLWCSLSLTVLVDFPHLSWDRVGFKGTESAREGFVKGLGLQAPSNTPAESQCIISVHGENKIYDMSLILGHVYGFL